MLQSPPSHHNPPSPEPRGTYPSISTRSSSLRKLSTYSVDMDTTLERKRGVEAEGEGHVPVLTCFRGISAQQRSCRATAPHGWHGPYRRAGERPRRSSSPAAWPHLNAMMMTRAMMVPCRKRWLMQACSGTTDGDCKREKKPKISSGLLTALVLARIPPSPSQALLVQALNHRKAEAG